MGWKSQGEAPFGHHVLDAFHVGQGLSDLGYVETQRLKQANFAVTVDVLFHRAGERFFLALYAVRHARRGFSPERLAEAYLARGWARPILIGIPAALALTGLFIGQVAGRQAGLAALVVSLVVWSLAALFLSDRMVREQASAEGPTNETVRAH